MASGLQSAATPYDKPMDDEHRKILMESRQALAKDMEPEEVLLHMTDPHLFTDNDKDKIMANNLTRQQRNEILLGILPRKGAGAYEVFKKTIKKAHRPLFTILVEAENKVLGPELTNEQENSADLQRQIRQSAGGRTCSLCSKSESALAALRREMDDKNKNDQEEIRSLKAAIEKEKNEKRDLMSERDRLKEDVNEKQMILKSLEDGSIIEGGGRTCSLCSKSESALAALRREMDDKNKEYEEEIRSLKAAIEKEKNEKRDLMSERERLKEDVNEKQMILKSLEDGSIIEGDVPDSLPRDVTMAVLKQRATFLACLCSTGNSDDHLLVLCCFPFQMAKIVWEKVSSRYNVVSCGKDTSRYLLNRWDNVYFSLPDALSPNKEINMETNFLQFLGHESFQTSFIVRVKKTQNHPQITFFKRNGSETTLCTLVVAPVSPPQVRLPRSDRTSFK